MQISVAKLEADVAGKRRILDEYKAKLSELEAKLDKSVDLERRQAELVQSIESMKENQSTLSARLEQARLGREADTNSESVQFRVIDPPRVPLKPSGPNRVLFSSAVLAMGLAVGIALAFLMSQLRPTFDERQVLNETLGLPVLGSVNMVWTSEQVSARRVRNATYIVSFTSLLLTFGVVLALYQFDINVLPRLAQSLNLS
jgi:capsular polysaccharide biosynthesis protein